MHDKQLTIIRSVLSLIAGMTLVLFQHPSLWAQTAVDCNKDAQVVNLAARDGMIRISPDRIGRHALNYMRILVDENDSAYAWYCVVPDRISTPLNHTPSDHLGIANKFVDLNWDGQVNRDDLVPFQEYYADCQSISSENFLYKDRCSVIDYNDDGVINIEDFALFREYIEQ